METKSCPDCQLSKSIDEFNWKNKAKGIRHTYCKPCWNLKNKERYENNKTYYIQKAERAKQKTRKWISEVKEHSGCINCGENHPACLHFHHRDPQEKLFEICDALLTRSKKLILEEIEKCDVMCANCHLKLHFEWKKRA